MSEALLRVVFEKPGWFLNDPRVVVRLDESTLHDGSFTSGFERTVEVAPGPHRLTTAIHVGGFQRKRAYELVLGGEGAYREGTGRWVARLDYSRFWGNFTKKLDLCRE
jgi:hypothetical protein